MKKIVIVGLGNSILSDDAVGIKISQKIENKLHGIRLPEDIQLKVTQNESGGWDVLDVVEGYDILILIDAITGQALSPGDMKWFSPKVYGSLRLSGFHSMDIFSALEMAKTYQFHVPTQIYILGIGINDITSFSEYCTPEVTPAIEKGADSVLEMLPILFFSKACP